jgi:hypothetical protein
MLEYSNITINNTNTNTNNNNNNSNNIILIVVLSCTFFIGIVAYSIKLILYYKLFQTNDTVIPINDGIIVAEIIDEEIIDEDDVEIKIF